MLHGRDDRKAIPVSLCTGFLLPQQRCFGFLQLLNFLRKSCISL